MAYDGNWIQELDETQPPGNQTVALGDDAIRELKRAILNCFPAAGASGDTYAGTFADLNTLVAGAVIPKDAIICWIGDQVALPDGPVGWTICDGRVRPDQTNAPNLINRVIIGADDGAGAPPFSSPVGTIGGNAEIQAKTIGTSTFWKGTTDGTALTMANLPSEIENNLQLKMSNNSGGSADTVKKGNGVNDTQSSAPVEFNQANSQAHTHTFKIDTQNTGANLPPYYTALWIIKD